MDKKFDMQAEWANFNETWCKHEPALFMVKLKALNPQEAFLLGVAFGGDSGGHYCDLDLIDLVQESL